MIELVTAGFALGPPHHLGAAGAIAFSEGLEIGRFRNTYRPDTARSALATELAILTAALESLRKKGGVGEVVTVRTGLSSLSRACRGGSEARTTGIESLLERLRPIAEDFEGISAVVSPGWVTAPALDLAVRTALERAVVAARREAGQKPPCPVCGGLPPSNPGEASP